MNGSASEQTRQVQSPMTRWHLPGPGALDADLPPWMLGLGCVVCAGEEPRVDVTEAEDGGWTATLCGHFILHVAGDHPFRFTPFSQDAQPRIRGKCPLELAGYDISRMPIARIMRARILGLPPESVRQSVQSP